VRDALSGIADKEGFDEFLRIIQKRGVTSAAEVDLVRGLLDLIHEQAKTLAGLKQMLLVGASKGERNAQPLPPKIKRTRGSH
jgi:hypothetical protein